MDFEEIITKYHLPSKGLLQAELGNLHFEENDDIIVELIKNLREKIHKYVVFMEDLMQPDSTLISMQESSNLSDIDRASLFKLFKKTVLLQRTNLLVNLDGNNDDRVAYFKQLFAGWQAIKKSLRPYIEKTLIVWGDGQTFEEVKQNYFG